MIEKRLAQQSLTIRRNSRGLDVLKEFVADPHRPDDKDNGISRRTVGEPYLRCAKDVCILDRAGLS